MIESLNVRAELNALRCDNRRPDTPEEELAGAFGRTIPYRDGFVSTVRFSGKSAWEMHPEAELVFVAEGSGTLLIVEDKGIIRPQSLHSGMAVIVPKDALHSIDAPHGIGLMTVTPQPTKHIRIDLKPLTPPP